MSTVTKTIYQEGPAHINLHVYLEGDGSELTDYVIIDPLLLEPALTTKARLAIEGFWYSLSGFSLSFEFDDLTDKPGWVLTPDGSGRDDFTGFGGIRDKSGLDGTGKILVTSSGMGAGDKGFFVIRVRKT